MNMCLTLLLPSFPFSLSEFKPDELRQALMPTLEALYRQDPESLPFRQPVDPQLLGIPVRIRTSNKTNLVRACAGTHYATTNLALFSSSLIFWFYLLSLFLSLFFLLVVFLCVFVCMRERERDDASLLLQHFCQKRRAENKAAQTMNICLCGQYVFISSNRQIIMLDTIHMCTSLNLQLKFVKTKTAALAQTVGWDKLFVVNQWQTDCLEICLITSNYLLILSG